MQSGARQGFFCKLKRPLILGPRLRQFDVDLRSYGVGRFEGRSLKGSATTTPVYDDCMTRRVLL